MITNEELILKKADELGMQKGIQKIMMELLDSGEKQEKMLALMSEEGPTNSVEMFSMARLVKYSKE